MRNQTSLQDRVAPGRVLSLVGVGLAALAVSAASLVALQGQQALGIALVPDLRSAGFVVPVVMAAFAWLFSKPEACGGPGEADPRS